MGDRGLAFLQLGFFDIHVSELAGFEDLATLKALDEFRLFFAGHNFHAGVLTGGHIVRTGWKRTGWTHRFRVLAEATSFALGGIFRRNWRYC